VVVEMVEVMEQVVQPLLTLVVEVVVELELVLSLVEQVVQVSWLQEHQELQEFLLVHLQDVHQQYPF
jgi:hypothetical protein